MGEVKRKQQEVAKHDKVRGTVDQRKSSKIHIHPGPQNGTSFGNRASVEVIHYNEVLPTEGAHYKKRRGHRHTWRGV